MNQLIKRRSSNSYMTHMKKQNGITLIALVVTIIVLIILAGISINLILGDNGIIVKAQHAKEAIRAANVKEQVDFWKMEQQIGKDTVLEAQENLEDLLERLVEEELLTEEEKEQIEATGKVTIGEMVIEFGTEKTAKTLVQAFKDGDIKIGDYLDYKPIEGTTLEAPLTKSKTGVEEEQNYTVDMSTTWRVLGLNEDGTELLIISGSPIKKDGEDPYLHLVSAEQYMYGIDTLNEISEIYHNSKYASTTRSITIEDINRALGITVDKTNNIAYKTDDETKTPLPSFQGSFGKSYTYKAGDYAPENYLGIGNAKIGDTVEGNAQMIVVIGNTEVIDNSTVLFDLLFENTLPSANMAKAYWLASKGINIVTDGEQGVTTFGIGAVCEGVYIIPGNAFRSDGVISGMALGVRPVISLKANITVDDLKVITGEEEEWSTSAYLSSEQSITKGKVTSPITGEVEFTIDGETYYADQNMTWGQWLESSYNYLSNDFDRSLLATNHVVRFNIMGYPDGLKDANNEEQCFNTVIRQGEEYKTIDIPL